VAEGDVIMKLYDPELDMAIAEATARKAAMPAGVALTDRRLLLSELNLQQQALRRQQERMAATEELVREGAATTAELREAQIAVDQTMAAVLRVQQQLEPQGPRAAASPSDQSRALQLRMGEASRRARRTDAERACD
jgi:hypothetical protein